MPRRIALIVGINQYDNHTGLINLSSSVDDAQEVYNILHQYGDFDTLYPLPLSEDCLHSSGYVASQTLQDKLVEFLALKSKKTEEEIELAVIYFSGHGFSDRGQVSYLSASDEKLAVALPWLINLAKNSNAKNICLWLDCCHSGEILNFSDLDNKGFCVIAASTSEGEALAINGRSLLTNLLCKALTPTEHKRREVRVLEFIQYIKAGRKNLPQHVLCRWGNNPFTLTHIHSEITVNSPYPPDYPPYKGLLAFKQADSQFFFGREGLIQKLLDRLSVNRFVPLLGASGSGKSSLIFGGLIPKLSCKDWHILTMYPSVNPLQNLRDTLVRTYPDRQIGKLRNSRDFLHEISLLINSNKKILLIIDQFEEVFTICDNLETRINFIDSIIASLNKNNTLHVVITLRSDFLGYCENYPELNKILENHLSVGALKPSELREIITRPLHLVGMSCSQEIEDELVAQMQLNRGSLPLLQYVLEKLWKSTRVNHSRNITYTIYKQLGGAHGYGLRGILNEKADSFYESLNVQQQQLMKWLMVELTHFEENSIKSSVRQSVKLQELHNRQPNYIDILNDLLEKLVAQERLLVQDYNKTISVSHEALIKDWKRLQEWLFDNRDIKRWRSRIKNDINDWQITGGSLLRDRRLSEAKEMLIQHSDSLLIGSNEFDFVQASINQQQLEQEEKDSLLKELLVSKLASQSGLALRSPRRSNGYLNHALLMAVTAFKIDKNNPLALNALWDANCLSKNLLTTLYVEGYVNCLCFSSSNDLLAVGMQAGQANHIIQIWDTKTGTKKDIQLDGHKTTITKIAFGPNGDWLVSCEENLTIFWDIRNGNCLFDSLQNVSSFAFSSNLKFLVCKDDKNKKMLVYQTNKKELWDTPTNKISNKTKPIELLFSQHLQEWSDPEFNNLKNFAICSQAKWLVGWRKNPYISSDNSELISLWYLPTGRFLKNFNRKEHKGIVSSIVFSNDDKWIITNSGGGRRTAIQIWKFFSYKIFKWEVATAILHGSPHGHKRDVRSIALSSNNIHALTGSWDKTLRLWDINKKEPIGDPIYAHEGIVKSVAFNPDGGLAASGSEDQTVRLWNFNRKTEKLNVHNLITGISFSPNGKYLAISGFDKVSIWKFKSTPVLIEEIEIIGFATCIEFNPNGETVLIGYSNSAQLILWNILENKQVGESWCEKDDSHGINCIALSPDGKIALSGKTNYLLQLWDVSKGKLIGSNWKHSAGTINCICFSPNGKYIATGHCGGSKDSQNILLWDAKTHQQIGEGWKGGTYDIKSLIFSPDSKKIVSTCFYDICIWDINTAKQTISPWKGHESTVNCLAFSPNGKWIISGSENGNLRLWDAKTGLCVTDPWEASVTRSINAVTYSPDGNFVISGGFEGTIKIWDADPNNWAKNLCHKVNRNFSSAEWKKFIGDILPYEKTCTTLPAFNESNWIEPHIKK